MLGSSVSQYSLVEMNKLNGKYVYRHKHNYILCSKGKIAVNKYYYYYYYYYYY